MAVNVPLIQISELSEQTTASDTDYMVIGGADAKKIKWSNLTGAIKKLVYSWVYPVGTIYFTVDSTNPGTKFGGTWVAWGAGRVPVGVNASDSNYNTPEKNVGNSSVSYTPNGTVGGHTLTINEIPSHSHNVSVLGYTEGSSNMRYTVGWGYTRSGILFNTDGSGGNGSHNHGFTGTAATISTIQPSVTCYMWKRTA